MSKCKIACTDVSSKVQDQNVDGKYKKLFNNYIHKNNKRSLETIKELYKNNERPQSSENLYYMGILFHNYEENKMEGIENDPYLRAAEFYYDAVKADENSSEITRKSLDNLKCIADDDSIKNAPIAQTYYATLLFEKDNNSADAGEYFRKAAERNNEDAQMWLAICYWQGHCGLKENLGEATKWITKAAKSGNSYAMFLAARIYESKTSNEDNPYEIEVDKQSALYWLVRAIERGESGAAEYLENSNVLCQYRDYIAQKEELHWYITGSKIEGTNVVKEVEKLIDKSILTAEENSKNIIETVEKEANRTNDDLRKFIGDSCQSLGNQIGEMNKTLDIITNQLYDIGGVIKSIKDTENIVLTEMEAKTDDYIIKIEEIVDGITNLQDTQNRFDSIQIEQLDVLKQMYELQKMRDQELTDVLNKIQVTIDENMSKVSNSVKEKYETELRSRFGGDWREKSRMSELCCDRLVAARVLLYYSIEEGLDEYRGVVISATSALEYELKKRFYCGYFKWINESELDDGKKNLIKEEYKYFNMGSMFYILSNAKKDPTERGILSSYLQNCIFNEKANEIQEKNSYDYAGYVFIGEKYERYKETFCGKLGNIKNIYRDRSAHTKTIEKQDALDCCRDMGIGGLENLFDATKKVEEVEGIIKELMNLTKNFEYVSDEDMKAMEADMEKSYR